MPVRLIARLRAVIFALAPLAAIALSLAAGRRWF
jgi:hypothetical protein